MATRTTADAVRLAGLILIAAGALGVVFWQLKEPKIVERVVTTAPQPGSAAPAPANETAAKASPPTQNSGAAKRPKPTPKSSPATRPDPQPLTTRVAPLDAVPQLRAGSLPDGQYAVHSQRINFADDSPIQLSVERVTLVADAAIIHFLAFLPADRSREERLQSPLNVDEVTYLIDDQGERYRITRSAFESEWGSVNSSGHASHALGPGEAFRFRSVFERFRGVPHTLKVMYCSQWGTPFLSADLVSPD